jgi:hypothetical protein
MRADGSACFICSLKIAHGSGAALFEPLLKAAGITLLMQMRQGDESGFRKSCLKSEGADGIVFQAG